RPRARALADVRRDGGVRDGPGTRPRAARGRRPSRQLRPPPGDAPGSPPCQELLTPAGTMTRVVKLRTRLRPDAAGVTGTSRTDRRTSALVARVSAGDVAVLDQVDLDGPTADALVEARVVAVLNRAEMISGRFPNRGPQILVDAGIPMVDQLMATGGRDPLSVIGDGRRVRVLAGSVLLGEEVAAEGREVTQDVVTAQLEAAHAGLATQLQTLTHNSAEFVRREEPLLLHGQGLPRLRTKLKGRPVVVVGQGPDDAAELRSMRRYLREMHPVIISTGEGLEVA